MALGPVKQRTVWAALLTAAGRLVTWSELVDRVWDEAPAGDAHVLYTYVNRIRRILEKTGQADDGAVSLAHRSGGYVLQVDADRVDVLQFGHLVTAAGSPECDDAERAQLLGEALRLWRGTALADLPGRWAARLRAGWNQQRLDAAIDWAAAQLRLGRHEEVIGTARVLLEEFPLAEPLAAAFMQALHASGRPAEALECYAGMRQRLAEEVGSDPGAALQAVFQAVLRGELEPAPPPSPSLPPVRDVPAQLPADVPGFIGRHRELSRLDAVLAAARQTSVVICMVSGTAGVGKTTLAVHWAHRVCEEFPDGQLYVNLRGFDADGPPVSAGEAIRGLLEALGVAPHRVPVALAAQEGLYRSVLAGKRILIVLDNAREAQHVRPLLPGTPGCLVLVTSRNELSSLVAAQGAQALPLDLLSHAEARQLLAQRLGRDRVAAQPRAVDEIVACCAHLPLALVIAAARAAAHPDFPLATLATELSEPRGGLDLLDSGDPTTDVRAVLACSYRVLSSGAARLFRLLGIHPGPDITADAAASLAGLRKELVHPLVIELTRANLATEHGPGGYAFHDLLRAYAAELAQAVDAVDERHAALRRVLDHYLHTGFGADRVLDPQRRPIALDPPSPGVSPERCRGYEPAMGWFTAERAVLVSAVKRAGAVGCDDHAWKLTWVLATFFDRQGLWHDLLDTHHRALASARRLADRDGQARMHRGLGRAYTELRRPEDARAHLQQALNLFGQLGDDVGIARAHLNLAWSFERQDPGEAVRQARHALTFYKAAGDRSGQARALNAFGWYQAQCGNHEQALLACQQALGMLQELGDRRGEATTEDSIGYAYHHLGDHDRAVACYLRSANLHHQLGNRYYEALTFSHLGDTHEASGRPEAARRAWHRTLAILTEIGHPDAQELRRKLRRCEDRQADPAPHPVEHVTAGSGPGSVAAISVPSLSTS